MNQVGRGLCEARQIATMKRCPCTSTAENSSFSVRLGAHECDVLITSRRSSPFACMRYGAIDRGEPAMKRQESMQFLRHFWVQLAQWRRSDARPASANLSKHAKDAARSQVVATRQRCPVARPSSENALAQMISFLRMRWIYARVRSMWRSPCSANSARGRSSIEDAEQIVRRPRCSS